VSDRPALKPAYLIFGNDRPKVRRAVSRLRQSVIDETGSDLNITVFDAETDRVDAVLEAAAMPGFTLGTRLLLVLNAHKWPAKARQSLAAYVRDPWPDTCVAVEGASFTEADPLRKAVAAVGDLLHWDLPKKYEMAGWVRKRAEAHHLAMGQAAARHFLERCGMDPSQSERLEREIEKLSTYCRGHEATPEDIDAVCSADDEARVFSLIDAVSARQGARAFALLEAVYKAGEDPNKIVYLLLRGVEQMEQATALQAADAGALAKGMGVPYWTAKRLLEQAAFYDAPRFARAYRALAAAEAGMRGRAPATLESEAGVNHTDRLVLELTIARLLA
jgi:DNA polymerase-3 subunit delta